MRLESRNASRTHFSRLSLKATAALLASFAVFSVQSLAQADGGQASVVQSEVFTCTSLDQFAEIVVKYDTDQKSDDAGPRAVLMVVRDLALRPERQTVAKFHIDDGGLNNSDGLVVGYVDLNHPNTSQSGKRIGGTKLGYLNAIFLEIDFSFRESIEDGGRYAAQVIYLKKNGEELLQEFDCIRDIAAKAQLY